MAIVRKYFPAEDFVLTWIHGAITDLQLHDHVIALNAECEAMGPFNELADCTGMIDTSGLTHQGLVIAAQLESFRPPSRRGRLAIVVDNAPYHELAVVYQAVCESFRHAVLVTLDYAEALAWLDVAALAPAIQQFKNGGGRP